MVCCVKFFCDVARQNLLKLAVNVSRSYSKNNSGTFLWTMVYISFRMACKLLLKLIPFSVSRCINCIKESWISHSYVTWAAVSALLGLIIYHLLHETSVIMLFLFDCHIDCL